MALTLTAGLSKKQGLPDYGSLGASCSVTVELDGSMLNNDLETFHRHVRNAYVACSQAVNDELARQMVNVGEGSNGHKAAGTNVSRGNGEHGSRNGNPSNRAHTGGNGNGGHRASEKQMNYVNQLAKQIRGLGVRRLEALTGRMFNKPLADLTSLDASSLIDTLKAIKDGRVSLDAALGNGAPL